MPSNEETDDEKLDGLARGDVNVLLLLTVIRAVPFGDDLLMLALKLSFDLHMTAAIIVLVFKLLDNFRFVSLRGVRTRDDVEDVDEDEDEEALADDDEVEVEVEEEEEMFCSIGVEFFISFEVSGLTGEIKELNSLLRSLEVLVLLLSLMLSETLTEAEAAAASTAVPNSSREEGLLVMYFLRIASSCLLILSSSSFLSVIICFSLAYRCLS